jgi:hypothetical protein
MVLIPDIIKLDKRGRIAIVPLGEANFGKQAFIYCNRFTDRDSCAEHRDSAPAVERHSSGTGFFRNGAKGQPDPANTNPRDHSSSGGKRTRKQLYLSTRVLEK